jgi:hypothetical protein
MDAKWLLPSEHFDSYILDWRGHIGAVFIEHVRLIPPPCSQYAQHNEMYSTRNALSRHAFIGLTKIWEF